MSGYHAATVTRCDSRTDFSAGPVMATVRQVSLAAPAPATATVQQQGALFGAAFSCCAFTQGMQKII